MDHFELVSEYAPTGDQPQAIDQLVKGFQEGNQCQTLLGVTGSGKTFTMANVIQQLNKPTLIIAHNKTLAAQLYGEFKEFFPNNAVEYYVSYYDYYQPEAYLPSSDTYIEKDLAINDEIDKLRLAATSALLSGRKDVVVVSSVSCIYGMGNPSDFYKNVIEIERGRMMDRNVFLRRLVDSLYVRNDIDLNRRNFRVKGDTVDIYLAYTDNLLRVTFWGDEIDGIEEVDPVTGVSIAPFDAYKIYPANLFMTTKEATLRAIHEIEDDLTKQVAFFESIGKEYEAKRIYDRVTYDMEMIRELGHCSGIENYSRYFDGRAAGTRPYCLLDFFPDDFLIVIDESHVSVPQIRAMYGGDRARKINLVEYGFRLPAAMDNRPLKFEEFQEMAKQVIYVSATPADYELIQSEGIVVEQVIRPTGLLDPVIEVRPSLNQIDDLMEEIQLRIEKEERVLVTTLTKRMAEELAEEEDLVLLCGHYEGIDERVLEEIVTDYVSIGDYVLTGGELPAMVMVDTISRLVPGVLHNDVSAEFESFQDNLLEYPQYSRPEEWHGKKVPPVLLSGHHANIEKWRREQSILRTYERRPDLLEKSSLTWKEKKWLEETVKEKTVHEEPEDVTECTN